VQFCCPGPTIGTGAERNKESAGVVSPLRRSSPRQAWVAQRVSSRVPSVSRVVLSFINNSQDTGVRRRDILVYCSCFIDRSAILNSNSNGHKHGVEHRKQLLCLILYLPSEDALTFRQFGTNRVSRRHRILFMKNQWLSTHCPTVSNAGASNVITW
jgi:hypothetical protein